MPLNVIQYENLTWTEVAQLPRHLPLVLPLGNAYSHTDIAAAIAVETFGILPPLPYGWRGSLVDVGEEMLRRVVGGIFSAMHDEGFTRLIVVHGGVENLDMLGIHQVRIPTLHQPTTPLLSISPERVLLISTGHVEQHGYHLPMNTDNVIIDAITRGTVAAIPDRAEMLPTLPYGVSTHRSEFAGTFNMGGRVYEDFMLAVLAQLVAQGADRFYLMSGHGGNGSFLVNIVKYAGEQHRHIFAATAFLHTSGRIAAPVVQETRRSKRGGMGHAGELETSYMLHLRPDLCHMERVVDEIEFISTPDYYMDWIEGGSLVANPPWGDDTRTGSYGAGSLATAENGKRWLEAAIAEKIAHVLEIHEQQDRRIAKRKLLSNDEPQRHKEHKE
jgi:creatinine amidohydrolase